MSKFENELMGRLSKEKDPKKIAERAFGKATNKVGAQIASLKYKRAELEDKLDDATEELHSATYCESFDIGAYDRAKATVDAVEDQIADVDETIAAREKLLEGWK